MISVAVDMPLAATLDYAWLGEELPHGTWVCVPLGRKKVLGLVIHADALSKKSHEFRPGEAGLSPDKIRSIESPVIGLPPMDASWIDFMAFASRYYRRPFGTVSVGLVPKWLRDLKNFEAKTSAKGTLGPSNFDRLIASLKPRSPSLQTAPNEALNCDTSTPDPPLNVAQHNALSAMAGSGVHVLHGVTGSGKTRVYTEATRRILAAHPASQVLMLVPEIGLTPQLVRRFQSALPGIEIAVLHSEVSERERARLWLLAATGAARLVIGTRLSIMTPMPLLALILIDEEHDHSYKQQEGMRYSARDLAIWRAQQSGATLVLGSATPSVETWAQIDRKRYQYLQLPTRATGEPAAPIRLIDTLKDPAREGLSSESRAALGRVLAEGGQALVFLNRRGYAPVLACSSCGWSSACSGCAVPTVLHRLGTENIKGSWRLQCHHCGLASAVPPRCPDCGDTDLQPIGRGVQRLEQTLEQEFPKARISRIDRDTVKQGRALEAELARIERGEVDIVVGTQMLAKGHDFARMRLVVVADADAQLLNPDFRAPERLFATLMQVAGRAGRHEQLGSPAEVLIQTRYPQHRLYRALIAQDVEGFARAEMQDREASQMPPFAFMAALRVSHRDMTTATAALRGLRDQMQTVAKENNWSASIYGPVARYPEVQAGRWRGQIMLESQSRQVLHQLLSYAERWLLENRTVEAQIDVDPYEI